MPQSIQTLNPEHYQDKYEKRLIHMAHKENLWERFMLGEKMDKDKFLHTFLMGEKVCPTSCEMSDYIWDKIEGNLKDCNLKKSGLHKIIKIYQEVKKTQDGCDAIEGCVPKIEW